MVSVDKHPSPSLKYTGPSGVPLPPGEPDLEAALCQTCLGDHAFQRGVLPQDKESCSWQMQSGCEVSSFLLYSSGGFQAFVFLGFMPWCMFQCIFTKLLKGYIILNRR